MSRFRALLAGVEEYEDREIDRLPCVLSDLAQISTALEARGYQVERLAAGGRIGRTALLDGVSAFLADALDDDTLLVYLTGHGIYDNGMTYLIPTDALIKRRSMKEIAVPLDAWNGDIEDSAAAGVVFLIGACREGFDETMAVAARTRWNAEKIARAQRRQVAWIFPCAEGEVARYVKAEPSKGTEAFSLFARAVVFALADPVAPETLEGFVSSIRTNMKKLTDDYQKHPQEIRLLTNGRDQPFVIFPQGTGEPRSWERSAAEHPAWKQVQDVPGAGALRDNTLSLVRHLAGSRHESSSALDDPWLDRGLATRMSVRTSFLLSHWLSDVTLSPAEAALLVAAPYLHDAHWSIQLAQAAPMLSTSLGAGDHGDANPEAHASFQRYVLAYPRLRRKAEQGMAQSELGWWLLHRWLAGQASAYEIEAVRGLLSPAVWGGGEIAVQVLAPERIRNVLRAIRADNGFFADAHHESGLKAETTIADGIPGEQRLRERLIAYLIVVAHRMTIEAAFLSDVISDHLGTADPVNPVDVHTTLEEATWSELGQARVLTAACAHPAIEVALREHADDFDGLLSLLHGQSRQSFLGVLERLPTRALADGVHPANQGGTPAYDGAGMRFRLAEDRVQELLMGEQLYGKPAAAIRELYQNALDACRYRQARTEYLRRTGKEPRTGPDQPAWRGSIRFEQGVDEQDRHYLDCIDTGIGMGRRELRDIFARAGVRFAELPEFLDEKYEWDRIDPPISFTPNSRFGVGVLSYFMLADEIMVDTCRFNADGSFGEWLQVTIAGPGALFRIQSHGPGAEAGTKIRLYLNPGLEQVSCVDVLPGVLKVAEFATQARHGERIVTWQPKQLGSYEIYPSDPGRRMPRSNGGHGDAVGSMPVWWVPAEGMLLVDGVRADSEFTISGAVVNLTGEDVRLSVDRTKIIALSEHALDNYLAAAIPALLASGARFLTLSWLWQLALDRPNIADQMLASPRRKTAISEHFFDTVLNLAAAGCFPYDQYLYNDSAKWRTYYATGYEGCLPQRISEDCTDHIAVWRLASLSAAGVRFPGEAKVVLADAVPAVPSDVVILRTNEPEYKAEWLDSAAPVTAGHVIRVSRKLGWRYEKVAERLTRLGFTAPQISWTDADLRLSSVELDGNAPWRTERSAISAATLDRAAAALGLSAAEVVKNFRRLGYDASLPDDMSILGCYELDADVLWHPDESDFSVAADVVLTAEDLQLTPQELVLRLRHLGCTVHSSATDLALAGLQLHGRPLCRASVGTLVDQAWISDAADRLEITMTEVTKQLREQQYVVFNDTPDKNLLDFVKDGQLWRRQHTAIARGDILHYAHENGRHPIDVAAALAALGYLVPSIGLVSGSSEEDLQLVSQELGGEAPWLADDRPVPAGHLVASARRLVRGIDYVIPRLRELGYTLPDITSVEQEDRVLISVDLNGRDPWLANYRPIGLWHLARIAFKLRRDPTEAAGRLRELGYDVAPGYWS